MIKLINPYIPPREILLPRIESVLYSGYIAEGENVKKFEKEMSEYIGNPNCLAVSSCTAALHLALLLLNIKYGDEVISTAMTAEPTNIAIAQSGAKVVWADINKETGLISPDDIEKKITLKTRAIMVVHYAGLVCDMIAINSISERYNIPIIEDAAHAFGARYDSFKLVGNSRNIVAFSFQAIKHLTTVDGGMICLPNDVLVKRAKELRWFGLQKGVSRLETNITEVGYKYNMNNVTAEIGRVQLSCLEYNVDKYIKNGKIYDSLLKNNNNVTIMKIEGDSIPSYWIYTILVENRDKLIEKLALHDIEASVLHKRNDLHELFNYSRNDFHNLDYFYSRLVHLPCGWWVNVEDIKKICSILEEGW